MFQNPIFLKSFIHLFSKFHLCLWPLAFTVVPHWSKPGPVPFIIRVSISGKRAIIFLFNFLAMLFRNWGSFLQRWFLTSFFPCRQIFFWPFPIPFWAPTFPFFGRFWGALFGRFPFFFLFRAPILVFFPTPPGWETPFFSLNLWGSGVLHHPFFLFNPPFLLNSLFVF